MLVMIDNYDSFTFNVVQYLRQLGAQVEVFHNDQITVSQLAAMNPDHLVISPGPCTPNEAGISMDAIRQFAGKLPILGICLGHQAIAQVFGGDVVRARQVMHGKTSLVHHHQNGVFAQLPTPFQATRYHSLVITPESVPEQFDITAWTESEEGRLDEVMGIRHKELDIEGVQFHPEAVLTEWGHELLQNFLQRKRA